MSTPPSACSDKGGNMRGERAMGATDPQERSSEICCAYTPRMPRCMPPQGPDACSANKRTSAGPRTSCLLQNVRRHRGPSGRTFLEVRGLGEQRGGLQGTVIRPSLLTLVPSRKTETACGRRDLPCSPSVKPESGLGCCLIQLQ